MKKLMTLLLPALLGGQYLYAQDVKLSDSIIFFDNKPVAFYYKELSPSLLRYNMEVSNASHQPLIRAEVIRFNAPIEELRPFYYYELSFYPLADTFSIYIEDEAFPLVLAKIIRDYRLIANNTLDRKAVARFKRDHPGGPALLAKIKEVEDYLNETRHLNEQVVRDRTKPVFILNERIVMQDGVKIGILTTNKNYTVTNTPVSVGTDKSSYGMTYTVIPDQVIRTAEQLQVSMPNGRIVELNKKNLDYNASKLRDETGKSLYELSKPLNKATNSYSDQLLKYICFLIEDYYL